MLLSLSLPALLIYLSKTKKAMTSVVNAVVQIEPFKFFHNINEGICNYYDQDTALSNSQLTQTSAVGNDGLPERSSKPAGIAHLGKRV